MVAQTDGFTEHFFDSDDGLRLYARDYPPNRAMAANDAPIVCLPGLTRNSRDFHDLATALSTDAEHPRRVITLDSRGRGLSERDDDKSRYTLAVEYADVVTLCQFFDLAPTIFIGTSRGGLILHLLATHHHERIRAVVLNDIGPVIEVQGLLHIRNYLFASHDGVATFDAAALRLQAIHGKRFPALSSADWLAMAHAIYREIGDVLQPNYDPAIAAPLKAMTLDTPLPDLWQEFAAFRAFPVLVIRGEHSDVLSAETVAEMQARHQTMIAMTASGQGHAPLLHKPDCLAAIRAFLAKIGG